MGRNVSDTTKQDIRKRSRWRRLKLWVLGIVLLASISFAVHGMLALRRVTQETIPDAYAAEWVGGMVVHHMAANGGAWPTGWEDLRDDYEASVAEVGRPWTFEELRNRVQVDWSADPRRLAEAVPPAKGPPFRVIWLRSGSNAHWRGFEPNQTVYDYLHQRGSGPASRPGADSPAPKPATQPVGGGEVAPNCRSESAEPSGIIEVW